MNMETIVQSENDRFDVKHEANSSVINWQLLLLLVLFFSCVFVAIKKVVHRHESRMVYMQLQELNKERDKLTAQWSRLKLEQATTLNQVRVEKYARGDLSMNMPRASEIKFIKEPILDSTLESGELRLVSTKTEKSIAVSMTEEASNASSTKILSN